MTPSEASVSGSECWPCQCEKHIAHHVQLSMKLSQNNSEYTPPPYFFKAPSEWIKAWREPGGETAMSQKWERTRDSSWSAQTSKHRLSLWTVRLVERKPEEGVEEPKMTVTLENVAIQKYSAAWKHPQTYAWTHTHGHTHPRTQTHTHRDKPSYTHISGWTGSYQEYRSTRRLRGKRLAEDLSASLMQLSLFTSSLSLCPCDCVRACVCVYMCVFRLLLGWLLWYYWVSNKPAREAPMGCTKCFPQAGVDRGAVGCSIRRKPGRRMRWVCSWFPLSNRSLVGARGLKIPARRRGSCQSVCKFVYLDPWVKEQEPGRNSCALASFHTM